MTAADLEALAQRVEREEPSDILDISIGMAVGTFPKKLHYTSSLDAAASLLGRTWMATITDADDEWFVLLEHPLLPDVSAYAPTEPRARTAAALRARAQERADNE